jgi:SAM-dependent methyltransferase
LWNRRGRPASAVGAELDDRQVDDCRARLSHLDGVAFDRIDRLDDPAHAGAYDGVICMEVLEHVVDVDRIIDQLWRLLAANGTLVVSVPVETGLPLLVKQAVRHVAAWRGNEGYRSYPGYTLHEYIASVFAGRAQHIDRPVYDRGGALPFHDHKGFNWRTLRDRLAARFAIEHVVASPLPLAGPQFATQMWFVAHKRAVGSACLSPSPSRP